MTLELDAGRGALTRGRHWAANLAGWEALTAPGSPVTVAYDPRNRQRFYIDVAGSKDDRWGWAALLIVGVLALVGMVFFVL